MKAAIAFTTASALLASAVASPSQTQKKATGTSSGSLPTVTVRGNAFFAGDDRFYIRGIDYQPGGSSQAEDPIANPDTCKRDIAEFKKLGINTVRIYTVDNSADHDECMSMLADAGIYLALDVNSPKYSINRGDPAVSYNAVYLQSVFATIDAFAQYDNTLLFFSGNEVINDDQTTNCAPYVKAVTRDMKQYIGSRGYRAIPVGYSAADVESNRKEMADYMNCGTDDQRSDFFAFNDYSWCDPSTFEKSGWDQKVEQYSNYSIPLFLSEFGCITNERQFNEIASLYTSDMSAVYSGGLVYEYSEEGSGYGLVRLDGDSVSETADFTALQDALAKTPSPQGDGGYKPDGPAAPCPPNSDTWELNSFGGEALPAMPEKAQQYMMKGAGQAPGLSGDGSQEAGTDDLPTATAGSGKVTQTAARSGGSGGSTGGAGDASSSEGAAPAGFAFGEAQWGVMTGCVLACVLSSLVGGAAVVVV